MNKTRPNWNHHQARPPLPLCFLAMALVILAAAHNPISAAAHFLRAEGEKAVLYGANLRGANLTEADFSGANFDDSYLMEAITDLANFDGASFKEAKR